MSSPTSDRKVVILVEPEDRSREAHRAILEDAGFEVRSFPDYRGALCEAESDHPLDLLITEIHLPAGTPHGLSLMAMMKLRRPLLQVMLTTSTDDQYPTAVHSVVLRKPIAPATLVAAVISLIGGPVAP